MSKAVFTLALTVYCGTVCNPVCHDVYKEKIYWVEYDASRLKNAVKKKIKSKEEARKLLEEIYGLQQELESHALACNTYDCSIWRSRRWYYYGIELLERFGVNYVEKACGCETECPELPDEMHPAEVVESAIYDIYPELADEFYFV